MTDHGETTNPILEAAGLWKHFGGRKQLFGGRTKEVQAVTDVSFHVRAGETLGIVGESGCGKSTTARLLMGLIEPDQGTILLSGRPVGGTPAERKALRRRVQMVFQDSFASLNPRMTIEASIAFGPRVHGVDRKEALDRARDLLGKVGLDPGRFAGRYPHELSGGQRQRVNIARALALAPDVVVLDEAVSALDKSVEAQVLNLLLDLKADMNLTYLFISHDLNVVRFISDHVLIMYLGKVAEYGPVSTIFEAARHPYTRALLGSMPSMDPDERTTSAPIAGDPPSPIDPPTGCRFHPRCPFSEAVCAEREPALRGTQHSIACHMCDPRSGHSRAEAFEP